MSSNTAKDTIADEPAAGRVVDARLHLMDRQILDLDGVPVGTVNDLELDLDGLAPDPGMQTVTVSALLTGPILATRIFGGRPPERRWVRIRWRVHDIDTAIHLGVRGEELAATWVERWVRDHVIARIPAGRHAPG